MSTARRLIVLRHAHSVRAREGGVEADRARALSPAGLREAARVGVQLRELGWVPQFVASSDSTRTLQTWTQMQPHLGGSADAERVPELYLAGLDETSVALAQLPSSIHTAMVIGHNNGWEEMVAQLCQTSVRMMPCTAALLALDADSWTEALARRDWRCVRVVQAADRPAVPT